jgi:hypothetical protein
MTERGFKGVWIPREIWLHPGLTLQEKILLAEIDSLDNENGCFANNKHFSEFLNISQRRVQELLKSLKDKGYIEITFLRGPGENAIDNRVMRVVSSAYPQPEEAARNPAQGGAENRVPPTKKTAQGYAESRAALYKDEKTKLENQESITPLNPPGRGGATARLRGGEAGDSANGLMGFKEFWAAYPRKKSKAAAERAWAKIRPGEELQAEILAALEQAKQSRDWQKEGGQYIPYPATWLNARGWEDELESAAPERRQPTFTEIAEMMDRGELF